jgi:hypothetical protein
MDNGIANNHGEGVEILHAYSHNVFVKMHQIENAGVQYKGHYHNYDHTTLVATGKVKVLFGEVPEAGLKEEERIYSAPSMFITRAFRRHTITTLEENTTFCCIHAIRDDDGDPINHIAEDKIIEQFTPKKEIKINPIPSNIHNRMTLSYQVDAIQYDEILYRADKEGSLEPGSQDDLI